MTKTSSTMTPLKPKLSWPSLTKGKFLDQSERVLI